MRMFVFKRLAIWAIRRIVWDKSSMNTSSIPIRVRGLMPGEIRQGLDEAQTFRYKYFKRHYLQVHV